MPEQKPIPADRKVNSAPGSDYGPAPSTVAIADAELAMGSIRMAIRPHPTTGQQCLFIAHEEAPHAPVMLEPAGGRALYDWLWRHLTGPQAGT